MLSVPFGRVLWKEYRTQRALWLSCLFIGVFFQVFNWYFARGSEDRESVLVFLPSLFGAMYAVGCGAMLFANERELRTNEWLIFLSPSPSPTLFAKLVFAVSSTIGLQLVLAIFSLVLNAGIHHGHYSSPLSMLTPAGLAVLIWSIFGSLLSRRVMASIPAMVFGFLLTFYVPLMICFWVWWTVLQRYDNETPVLAGCVMIGMGLLVLCADVWLGWKWSLGSYLDGTVFERFGAEIRGLWSRVGFLPTLRSRLPVRVEYEQSWRRTWQRLIWQELRRDSAHRLILAAGCAIGFVLAFMVPPTFFILVVCLGISIAMGVIGFESDSEQQQARFLCNRGISPGSVWLAKQVVWLPRALWIPFAVLIVSVFFEWWLVPRTRTHEEPSLQKFFAKMLVDPDPIWCVMLCYGCGQFVSIFVSRVVLAGVLAIVLSSIVLWWQACMVTLVVPRWWSLGLPLVAMLTVTFWQMKARMLEEHSWSRRLKVGIALLAIPVTLLAALIGYRVTEVTSLPQLDANAKNVWQQFVIKQDHSRTLTNDEKSVRDGLDTLSRSKFLHESPAADEMVALLNRDVEWLDVSFATQRASDVWTLTTLMQKRADEYAQEQQLDKALECHLASLKLARVTSTRSALMGMWWIGTSSQSTTLENIVTWANQPSQTPDNIREAIKSVEAELFRFPTASEAIVSTYLDDRKIVDSYSFKTLGEYSISDRHLVVRPAGEYAMTILLPWERKRLDILMIREAEFLLTETWKLESSLLSLKRMPIPKNQQSSFAQLQYSSAQLRPQLVPNDPQLAKLSRVNFQPARTAVLNRHTAIRAALTRMELIAHRLEVGRLPDRLLELMENIDGKYLVDPWSDRLFDFYPTFLLSSGGQNATIIPVGPLEVAIDTQAVPFPLNFHDVTGESSPFASSSAKAIMTTMHGPTVYNTWLFPIPIKSDVQPAE